MILPKITVITPTLNTGESIEISLLSVANQTYKNIEHLIVDGASKDKTLPTIRRYQKLYKNIRLITEKDSGIYDAMNKGMAQCTGEWIYFMGADDAFYNENVLTDLFEQGLFQEEQVVYGNVIIKGDVPWARDNTMYDGPFTLEKLFRWNICHQSIFYPKSVIRQIGFYETKYKITSDWDYNIRCWAKYKFTYTDKIIAFFKTGGKSSAGGDYSLHLDFPYNVIKYFQLDVLDSNLYLATSPFYYAMSRYRENEYIDNIRELNAETERLKQNISDQQTGFNETLTAMQKQHEESKAALRTEFDETLTAVRTEQGNFLAEFRSEHGEVVKSLKSVYDQLVNNIKAEHDHRVTMLKTDQDKTISNLNAEYDHVVNNLKTEHDNAISRLKEEHDHREINLKTEHNQFVTNLKAEHDLSIAALTSGHLESVSTLKNGYEEIIKSLQAEQRASLDLFRQKEAEFMEVIESNNKHIDQLNNTISGIDLHFRETVEKYDQEIENLKEEIFAKNQEIATILNSLTWKTGKFLLAPAVFIAKAGKSEKTTINPG
jgi:glycosyltransferase involved in cell wall biosynthesis